MPQFAASVLTPQTNGIPYATGAVLSSLESDLYNQPVLSPPLAAPVCLTFQQALVASVQLVLNNANPSTYVVLQTDCGDNRWIDVSWCVTSQRAGTLLFALSAGIAGANAIQQTRTGGTAPASSGFNQIPLGSRFRFVGATGVFSSVASSSLSSGILSLPAALVNINYKLLPLR